MLDGERPDAGVIQTMERPGGVGRGGGEFTRRLAALEAQVENALGGRDEGSVPARMMWHSVDGALHAYAQVNEMNPATLLIAGDVRSGEDRQFFEGFKRSHPKAQILVTGFLPHSDLPAYYSLMDVFVQPSVRDGLPNALLEAMACERAVIGTPAGGISDVIVDCKNGRLVPANHVEELADVIEEVLTNESLRKELGVASRQTILEKFPVASELNGNLDVYKRLGLRL